MGFATCIYLVTAFSASGITQKKAAAKNARCRKHGTHRKMQVAPKKGAAKRRKHASYLQKVAAKKGKLHKKAGAKKMQVA